MADHALARLPLSLGEIEDRDAIGVAIVVSRGDRLDSIGLLADVLPHAPPPGGAPQSAISQVQTGFDLPVVRLAAWRELPPGGACAEICVPDRPGHGKIPLCPTMANIRA